MRIAILADFHGKSGTVHTANRWAAKHDCEVIIQAGDFYCYQEESQRPLYWIAGNHEDWSVIGRHLNDQYELGDNQYHVPDWTTQYFDEVCFGFVGRIQKTNWHLNNREMLGGYKRTQHPLTGNIAYDKSKPEDRIWIDEDLNNADAIQEADVLVFHDKPRFDLADVGTEEGESFLCDVVREVEPELVVHGHWHEYSQMEPPVAPCPVIGLPAADGTPWIDPVTEQQMFDTMGIVYDTDQRDWSLETVSSLELP